MPVFIKLQDEEKWLRASDRLEPPLELLQPLDTAELQEWKLMPCLAAA